MSIVNSYLYCFIVFLFLIFLLPACTSSNSYENVSLSSKANLILIQAEDLNKSSGKEYVPVFLDSAFQTLGDLSLLDKYGKYNFLVNFYAKNYSDMLKANIYADSILALLKGNEDQHPLKYVTAMFLKADLLFTGNSHEEAAKFYYEGREYAQEHLDSCDLYEFRYRLGVLRFKQGRFLEALPNLKLAFSLSQNCTMNLNGYPVFVSRQSYLNTIGVCFERANELDSAIYYYDKTLAYVDEQFPHDQKNSAFAKSVKGVVYGNLGGVYAKQNKFELAESYLKNSIQINYQPGDHLNDARTAMIKLARLYIRSKKYKQANEVFKELQRSIDSGIRNFPSVSQVDFYELKWLYFSKTRDHVQADRNMRHYYHLRDSIDSNTQKINRHNIDAAIKANELEFKIVLLDKNNHIKEVYLIAIVTISVIALSVLVMVWRNRRELKLVNEKIVRKNSDLQMMLKALEQSQKETMLMMKIVAHDLRNPIAAAINVSEMLSTQDLEPKYLEVLELLKDLSEHSMEMIENLLNVNLDSEDLIKEPVEMGRFLNQCVGLLKFKAAEKGQLLETSVMEMKMMVNKEKMWRLFSNLIYNAIKFSPFGAKIRIGMYLQFDMVVFFIRDAGIGIPSDLQDKIFDMFTEASRAGTGGENSHGLGLAISKQIVIAHQGTIWVETNEDKGCTFYVKLPIGKI